MRELIEKLADSLVSVSDDSIHSEQKLPDNLQEGYRYFLSLCDGGYSEDRFFHFFGQKGPRLHNLLEWNRTDYWKQYYDLNDKAFVFAEDVFGTQFCFDIRGNRRVVKMLIPDGGKLSLCANTFEEFLETEVLSDTNNLQVRQLAKKFFSSRKEISRPFTHIACKIPLSLGGQDTDLSNLDIVQSSTNLKILGQITSQVKRLAPGTKIKDIKIDYESEKIILVPQMVPPI
jgi:hypothetical protein